MCAPRAGAARRAPAAGARERDMAALFVFAAVLLTVPAVVRAGRRARRQAGGDAPARLLAFAVTGLPEATANGGGRCAPSSKRCAAAARVALQPWLRPCGGRDPGARGVDVARARRRRPARGDRRGPRRGAGARRLRPGPLPGLRSGATPRSPRSGSWRCSFAYGAVTLALSRGTGLRASRPGATAWWEAW